jgi:membrane protein implicated in regulation of membrane protease activity
MTQLHAISPGILTVLAFWALWYVLDPPLRPEGISWPRLLLWIFTPLAMYVVLYRHREPPSLIESPVGKEGTVVQVSPLEVEVFGSFWHARCAKGISFRIADRVRVVERDGLTLVVERLS